MKRFYWLGFLALGGFWACKTHQSSVPPPAPPQIVSLPATPISLTDLSAFQDPTVNWLIAGNVSATWDEEVDAFKLEPGTSVLVNHPTEEAKGALRSQMEHGDIELSFDFMMPKGSNSGVYLMGRYEIQLLDSWGRLEPTFGDCGGIYERWDESKAEGQKGYEGHPPILNACRAPGLWQHMKIRFQAPRFNDSGEKTSNAKVISIIFNGKQIQRNVELSGPTRGSFFEEEASTGPIIIQGDHGPVAFRNTKYKLFGEDLAHLQDMRYRYFEVETFDNRIDSILHYNLSKLSPKAEGQVDSLSWHLAVERDNHILSFIGKIQLPKDGLYVFKAKVGGGCRLEIDGKEVLLADGERAFNDPPTYGDIELTAGLHDFSLTYLQNHRWWRNGLGLWMEGPGIDFQPLHAKGSVPPYRPPSPLWVEVNEKPKVMRGFVMFGKEKLTHTASVGNAAGVHFNYDLNQAKLLSVWRGPFIDVAPMWVNRGETQLAIPGGAVLGLSGLPSFLPANTSPAVWPDSVGKEVRFLGYDLDTRGMPVFRFAVAGGELNDNLRVADKNIGLTRTISANELEDKVQVMLAQATSIEEIGERMYVLDDRKYYLRLKKGEASIVDVPGGQRLEGSISGDEELQYDLVW